MRIIPSILHGERIAYRLDSSWSDNFGQRGSAPLHLYLSQYETYGDGTVQHSGHFPVQLPGLADACLSLAEAIAADPGSDDWQPLFPSWGADPTRSISFALGLESTAKRRWYSLSELKVSTSESRQHDRRWHPVPDWANGTPHSALRLLQSMQGPSADWFPRIDLAYRVVRYASQHSDRYWNVEELFKDVDMGPNQDWPAYWQSYHAAITAAEQLASAKRLLTAFQERRQFLAREAAALACAA